MKLIILLADDEVARRNIFRREILKLAEQKEFEYRLYTAKQVEAWQEIPENEWYNLSLAFIHMDYPNALEIGKKIYKANPFCRLTYYADELRNVVPLLPSRPIGYALINADTLRIKDLLSQEYDKLLTQQGYFHYSDRYQSVLRPYSAIHYFMSKDRKVYYVTAAGEQGAFSRTLDQIAKIVDKDLFIRCHKSFLVNRNFCTALDKSTWEIILIDGEKIPVSKVNRAIISTYFE